ncbi:RNA chaperone ProQ [Aliiglaciecola lipolytica]|uniref:RNA chaperone ProQ n=1 Tax=Aliiglaciecola lipolytica E3 TaxID=1127673 RepID=K6XT37_9ALTE|nr:RNA chaperone ProQ [Aliiglaciecola lipolytica]GAC14816.1 ProP effector [Aliiglaciecola lipolytica E3]
MENQQKFSNSKEVIAFLAQTFPKCFSLEGEAKPLKIGIFQELSERLKEDERISKTLLRASLRHYTNSWRYLHSVKQGSFRIDLDGNQGDAIEQEHADHALKQLNESKAKVAEKRKQANATKPAEKKSYKVKAEKSSQTQFKGTKVAKHKQTKQPPPEKLTESNLVVGTEVTVKVGKSPLPATITDISKDEVHVQLQTGMIVKVQADNLRLARPKR